MMIFLVTLTSERSSLDEVSRVVASSWIDREHFVGGESPRAYARLQETSSGQC